MNQLPALPDDVSPNEPVVQFSSYQCRECREYSPVLRANVRGNIDTMWEIDHLRDTGHREFYSWTITRETMRIR